ncbi:outer membrane beta-barrel protein [Caulobacter endophyticus]|uniref:Outer membrane beta-barrel protein n=1 Tax=Caulobacter endophyticus TaxID=2172652 RepID=A0A2T9JXI0_9CAUL|nr:outer membrane beta-barrel protein [Caulobacter endophyticus]PVM88353.1 hypothetical protein DDF67_13325 [Caulobacter endophyticus]
MVTAASCKKAWLAAAALVGVAAPSLASAQVAAFDETAYREGLFSRQRNVSVRQRPRPEFSRVPKAVGGFMVSPTLTGELEFNDNIYATNANVVDDTIVRIQPSIVARSNWGRHALNGFARANVAEYLDNDQESATDWIAGATARYDILRGAGVQAGASYEKTTESRTSSGARSDLSGPNRFESARVFVGASQAFARLRLSGQANYRTQRFDDNRDRTTGAVVSQGFRDRDIYVAAGRAEYAVSPDTSVFFTAAANKRDGAGALAAQRDSTGYDVGVGANFDLGGLARGEFSIGYLDQDYDNQFSSVNGLSARGQIEYFPTQLISVTASVERGVEDSPVTDAAGFLSTSALLQVDYELLRNLIITGSASWGDDDYAGIQRQDKRWGAALAANYLLSRTIGLNLRYQHYDQESEGANAGRSYDVNSVVLGLSYRF